MIVDFMIHAFIVSTKAIFGILPSVAATPSAVSSGGQWIIDQITAVIAVLNMVFTAPLMAACVIVIVGMFNFEWIYRSTMWILKKIPMINMK